MKAKILLLFIAFLVSQQASAKDFTIYRNTDDFKGNTLYFTQPQKPKLDGGSFVSMRYVYFSFLAASPIKDPAFPYAIKFSANLQDWIFIEKGQTLFLKLDGEIVTLEGSGSSDGRNVSSMGVEEISYYPLSLAVLGKMARAQKIEFKVYGKQGQISGIFTPKIMSDLKIFAKEAPSLINDSGSASEPKSP